ncbi:hypothetical protein BHYA_0219g00020 [Botrytis hyacinthi]|uniref:Uncharacterized protein n=1 Tax=Botrytis hyacinthi TaxID=278943 RepID=A0A4Z1GAW6_9HELO|nr:hypothetical protein BHYA_0219g00020 [Botrytis hyacinthi]
MIHAAVRVTKSGGDLTDIKSYDMKSIASELDESIAREWLLDKLSRMDEEDEKDETAAYCVELQFSFDFFDIVLVLSWSYGYLFPLNLEELIAACTFLMQQSFNGANLESGRIP